MLIRLASNYIPARTIKDRKYDLIYEKYPGSESGRYWLADGTTFFPYAHFNDFTAILVTHAATGARYLFTIDEDSKNNRYSTQAFGRYLSGGNCAVRYKNDQLGYTFFVLNPNFITGYSGTFYYMIDTARADLELFFYQEMTTISQANGDYFFDCSEQGVFCSMAIAPGSSSSTKNRGLYACDDPAKAKVYDFSLINKPWYYRVTSADNGLYSLTFTANTTVTDLVSPPAGYFPVESEGKLGVYIFGALKRKYTETGAWSWYIDTAYMSYYAKWCTTVYQSGNKMRLSSSQANPVYYEADYPDASMTSLLFTLVVPEGEAAPPYSPTTLTFYRTLYSPYTGVKTGINVTTDKIHLLTDAGGCL